MIAAAQADRKRDCVCVCVCVCARVRVCFPNFFVRLSVGIGGIHISSEFTICKLTFFFHIFVKKKSFTN